MTTLQDLNKYKFVEKSNQSISDDNNKETEFGDLSVISNSKKSNVAENKLYAAKICNGISDCQSAKSTKMRCDDDDNDIEDVEEDNLNIDVDDQSSDNDSNLSTHNDVQKSSVIYNNMFLNLTTESNSIDRNCDISKKLGNDNNIKDGKENNLV